MRGAQRARLIAAGVAALTALLALFIVPVHGQSKTVTEQELKVALIYNFAKFVTWPPDAFDNGNAPIVIAVLGERPFADRLDHMTADKLVKGRLLDIRRLSDPSERPAYHILFVDSSKAMKANGLLASLAHRAVLTIGETPGFADSGGMIELVTKGDVVRFRVNVVAAERAGLKISAKLLRVAETVDKREKEQ